MANRWPVKIIIHAVVLRFNFVRVKRYFGNRWALIGVFWPNFYCTCAETAISEPSVKILTPPFDSATLIFYMVRIFWRSVGICCDLDLWPFDFKNRCSLSNYMVTLCTEFKRNRTIRGWLNKLFRGQFCQS